MKNYRPGEAMRFADQVVIVTGGGGEIGAATARRFAREGAIVVVADLQAEAAEKVAAEINAGNGRAWAQALNVAERAEVEAMVNAVVQKHGRIDVLCNIAGIA